MLSASFSSRRRAPRSRSATSSLAEHGADQDNVTDKAALVSIFGEPYQVGLDNGDQTWRWFFAQRSGSDTITKDLTVRFNANGTVKSYSFTSNFPEDMRKLR